MRSWGSWFIGLVALVFLARPALAADWSISSFRSAMAIHQDASMNVTETIQTDFDMPKHGIFRNIPFRYATNDGDSISVPLQVEGVKRDGQNEPYTTSTVGDALEIKIGDADVTVTGSHTYEISYTVQAVVNFFDDHDELYWNATGDDWEVPLQQIEASVRLDDQVPVDQVQVKCFSGMAGSRAQICSATADDSAASFSSQDFLTIVFGWPKGVVQKPANYDELRMVGTTTGFSLPRPVLWALNFLLPLLAVAWVVRRWMTHGRDPRGRNTIVPEYDPPPGLTPGEMGTLFDEHANHRDVVATIVDLAVRGHLTITETEQEKFLGLSKSKDFRLEKKRPPDKTPLKPHEQRLYEGLFAEGDAVTLSELKGTFAADVRNIQNDLYVQVRDDGLFVGNPNTVRLAYIIGGVVVAGAGFFLLALGIFGVIIAGAAIAIAGPFMPQRTSRGVESYWHARGFKLFLAKAEKYRLQWQEKEKIFEKYLPYAMAFGVAEQWSKTFEGIQQAPPNWYHGAYGPNFNSLILWSALNNFSTTTVRSFAPPAASGGSGFGGGGFSGGGFGGGGGGSW